MKLTKTTFTTITIIVASLIAAGIFVCLKTNVNCRALFRPRNCIVEHMKRMEPSFGGEDLNNAPGNEGSKPCSGTKREVFVDGRRLYWGNLGELTKPERLFAPHNPVQATRADNEFTKKNEVLQQFTQELRAALKAFEKRYCLKINWRKKELTMSDVTTQFINFWDTGFEQVKEKDHSK